MKKKYECRTCMFWLNENESKQGSCRRFPPVPVAVIEQNLLKGTPEMVIKPFFPTMLDFGWCGEWQQRADQ